MLIRSAVLLLSLLTAGMAAANDWPDAYSRRDFKLGMTLNEFKKQPYPDSAKAPKAYSVCSNEKRAQNSGYEDSNLYGGGLEKAGVIKCSYYWDDASTKMVFTAGLMLADLFSHTEFYFLSTDKGKEPVLFWIVTGGPTGSFDGLVPVMTKAYGQPEHKTEQVQNGVGNVFTNDVYTWRNSSSSIELKRFGNTLRVFQVDHVLEPLMAVFNKRLEAIQGEQAKKL